jgi:hypothetical protein
MLMSVSEHTLLHKIPDMHYVKHKLVKNMRPSHNVKHNDTQVPHKCSTTQVYPSAVEPGSKQLVVIRYG